MRILISNMVRVKTCASIPVYPLYDKPLLILLQLPQRLQDTICIRLGVLGNGVDVDPVTQSIIHALHHLPLLHHVPHQAHLVGPVSLTPASQLLVPHGGVVDDSDSVQLALDRQQPLCNILNPLRRRGQLHKSPVRRGQVHDPPQNGVKSGQRDESVASHGPVEEIHIGEARSFCVGLVAVRADNVGFQSGQGERRDGCQRAPLVAVLAREGRARNGRQGNQVCQVRPEEGRQSIVQVALWFVGVAKRAVGEDLRAELGVQQAAFHVDKLGSQGVVAGGEDVARAEDGHTVEEHVDGDLEAALRAGEEVLGRKGGQGLDDVDC